MALYTRHQLILLLAVLAAAATGLGVRQWRAAFPELAERLETLDRVPAETNPEAAVEGERAQREPPSPTFAEDPRARPSALDRRPAEPRPGPNVVEARPRPEPVVDLNRATAEELMRLPGVGPVLADRIVRSRESQGRFNRVDDLRRVRGIGPATLERLRPLLTVSD